MTNVINKLKFFTDLKNKRLTEKNKMLADREAEIWLRVLNFGDDIQVIRNFYKQNPNWIDEEFIDDIAEIQRDLTKLTIFLNSIDNT